MVPSYSNVEPRKKLRSFLSNDDAPWLRLLISKYLDTQPLSTSVSSVLRGASSFLRRSPYLDLKTIQQQRPR